MSKLVPGIPAEALLCQAGGKNYFIFLQAVLVRVRSNML